jgi:hypothetical protein
MAEKDGVGLRRIGRARGGEAVARARARDAPAIGVVVGGIAGEEIGRSRRQPGERVKDRDLGRVTLDPYRRFPSAEPAHEVGAVVQGEGGVEVEDGSGRGRHVEREVGRSHVLNVEPGRQVGGRDARARLAKEPDARGTDYDFALARFRLE